MVYKKLKISIQNILPFVCWFFLLIPNIVTMCVSTDFFSLFRGVAYFCVLIVFLLLPAVFLRRRTYFIVEGLIALFWAPVEMASLYLNKATVSVPFLRVIFETNISEAMEVIQSTWPLLLIFVAVCILYGISVLKMENTPLLSGPVAHAVMVCLPVLAASGTLAVYVINHINSSGDTFVREFTVAVVNVGSKFGKIYPYDIYLNFWKMTQQNKAVRELNAQLSDFSFGLEPKRDDLEEHYILVIGEAARYDRFSRNGYSRNTSLTLDTVLNLSSLSGLFSQANCTQLSLQILLTRADISNMQAAYKEKTIVDAFEEAGFQTAWLNNQLNSVFEERIANAAAYEHHVFSDYSGSQGQYDESLVKSLSSLFRDYPSRKTFYVLHLMGSHFKYNERYPLEFEHFRPAMQPSDGYSVLSPKKKEILDNSYDNTILYTDYVLSQILELLKKQQGVRGMLFVSDHGENLCDDERALSVHVSYEGTVYESHIPCFVWLSPEFRGMYPTKVKALSDNIDIQVSSDVIFYSLADLGGLDTIVDHAKSIFSPQLRQQDTVYMVNGMGTLTRIK